MTPTPKQHSLLPASLLLVLLILAACAPAPRTPEMAAAPERLVPAVRTDNYVLVTVQEGDTFSGLAARYLQDPGKGWVIAAFNDATAPTPGREIIIPLKPYKRGGISDTGLQAVPVLVYHNFDEHKAGNMTVKEADFEAQMRFLKENGYTPISLDRFLDFLDYRHGLPEKSVLITLDDGWCSTYRIAYPILKKYGFPATLFIYSDFIREKGCMSWQQLRELAESGFDIQCHTRSHRNLNTIEEEESFADYFATLKEEVIEHRTLLRKKLGNSCDTLAYPYGETNSLVIAMLRKEGVKAGFTVSRGANPFYVNRYRIRRSVIYGDDDLETFTRNLTVTQTGE